MSLRRFTAGKSDLIANFQALSDDDSFIPSGVAYRRYPFKVDRLTKFQQRCPLVDVILVSLNTIKPGAVRSPVTAARFRDSAFDLSQEIV